MDAAPDRIGPVRFEMLNGFSTSNNCATLMWRPERGMNAEVRTISPA